MEVLVEARRQHPNWGARKLVLWVANRQSGLKLPAASTDKHVIIKGVIAVRAVLRTIVITRC